MKTLTQLQEERGQLVTQARAALEEIKSNTDESRAAELSARHDKIMSEFDALEATIKREQRQAEIEASFEEERAARRPTPTGSAPAADLGGGAEPSYRDAFLALMREGFDPQALTSEERSIIRAGVIAKVEGRALNTGSNSAGGYTVPKETAAVIDKAMKLWGPMYDSDICTVLTTSSGNQLEFPTTDDTSKEGGQHTEGGDMTDDGSEDPTFGQMVLNGYAYDTEWVRVSMELLQDSAVDMEAFLGELLGERLGRRCNRELTTGDGTGDPNGIVTASGAGKTAASATAITGDEIIDLFHSVDPAYRQSPKARFMFNDLTLAAIRKLKDGDGNYLWQMGDIRAAEPGAILGKPYSINQAMASIAASAKAILFGDFGKYYVRRIGAPVIGVRREYYWPNIGLAGVVRLDGDLIRQAAVKHLVLAAS